VKTLHHTCSIQKYSLTFDSQEYKVNVDVPSLYDPTDLDIVDQLPIDEWEKSPDVVVLQEQLGSGNFGEVYKAIVTKTSTGPTLGAVKLLKG